MTLSVDKDDIPTVPLLAAGAVAVGSFLPWATVTTIFGTLEVAGTTGDGKITLALGAGALVAFLVRKFSFGALLCALAGLVAGYDFFNISERVKDVDADVAQAEVGYGVYICVIGSVVGLISAWQADAAEANKPGDAPRQGTNKP